MPSGNFPEEADNSSDSSLDSAVYPIRSSGDLGQQALNIREVVQILGNEKTRSRASSIPQSLNFTPLCDIRKHGNLNSYKCSRNSSASSSKKFLLLLRRKMDHKSNGTMDSTAEETTSQDSLDNSVSPIRASTSNDFTENGTNCTLQRFSSGRKTRSSRKKETAITVLSSQNSNSQVLLDRGPSIYSFGPDNASPFSMMYPQIQKSQHHMEKVAINKVFWSQKDSEFEVWNVLRQNILALMVGEGLKLAIEDYNSIITAYYVHMMANHKEKVVKQNVIKLVNSGLSAISSNISTISNVHVPQWFFEIWSFFHISVLPYLEAIFLPIFLIDRGSKDIGAISKETNHEASCRIKSHRSQNDLFDIKQISFESFRDIVVLQNYEKIQNGIEIIQLSEKRNTLCMKECFAKDLQAISILISITCSGSTRKQLSVLASHLK